MSARSLKHLVHQLLLISLLLWMPGCRLYEPQHYQRLAIASSRPSLKVLFVGNSLTYYNDLPGLVEQLSCRQSKPIQVESVTWPWATLKFHWETGIAARKLGQSHWDYVILQEFSTLPATDPRATIEDFRRFNELINHSGAALIIFENWTHLRRPQDEPAMAATYRDVQATTGGVMAPIGTAFRDCQKTRPQIDLIEHGFGEDGRHSTVAGTYLAACVISRVIYHQPAVNLPSEISGINLTPSVARDLQRVADQIDIAAPAAFHSP
jgi:hypothetical protein